MPEFVYGLWPIIETLRAKRRVVETLLLSDRAEEKGTLATIIGMAKEGGLPVSRVPRRILDDLANGNNHQGAALRVGAYPYVGVEDMLQYAAQRGEKPFLLLLDLLQDPQNVGSLLRVADAVGIHGIILQERRGVAVTASVVSASSGAVEHLRVAQVTNLSQTMLQLKEEEIWFYGMDIAPNLPPLDKINLGSGAMGLVLGSEGEGLRRLVKERCDYIVTLPMRGHVGSLNVATAGSIALYAVWQARGWQGWQKP
jgi:23S rRNA (guanosine2251-2'-O)-methyltransferase